MKINEDQQIKDQTSALNPTVVKLGLVSLFADISSEMLYPITPIFLTTVLGASLASLGVVEGVAEATASLLKTWMGQWSDQSGRRRPFITVGYLMTALAKPWIGLAGSWSDVLLARSLDRAGKGLRGAPRDAMIADAVPPHLRGAAFGWHRGMDTLGAAIGPLIAIYYLHFKGDNLRGIFMWALVPGLMAVLITLWLPEKRGAKKSKPIGLKLWDWSAAPISFRRYLGATAVFAVANSSDVFLLLKAKASGMTLTSTILIYCFYNLVYAATSPGLGHLSDRIGRKPLLIGGFLIFAFVYLGFAAAVEPWQFWLLFGIYGIYMAATDGVGKAFAIDLIPARTRATGIGMLGTVTGIGALLASVSAGYLWEHIGASSAFAFGAIGALMAAMLVLRIQPELQRETSA